MAGSGCYEDALTIWQLTSVAVVNPVTLSVIFIVIILFSISLRYSLDWLELRLRNSKHPEFVTLLHHLVQELMTMGLLNFSMTLVESFMEGHGLLTTDTHYVLEFCHLVLFFTSVFFVFGALYVVIITKRYLDRWRNHFRTSKQSPDADIMSRISQKDICLLSDEFIAVHKLSPDFDFIEYISRVARSSILDIIDLSPTVWWFVCGIFVCNILRVKGRLEVNESPIAPTALQLSASTVSEADGGSRMFIGLFGWFPFVNMILFYLWLRTKYQALMKDTQRRVQWRAHSGLPEQHIETFTTPQDMKPYMLLKRPRLMFLFVQLGVLVQGFYCSVLILGIFYYTAVFYNPSISWFIIILAISPTACALFLFAPRILPMFVIFTSLGSQTRMEVVHAMLATDQPTQHGSFGDDAGLRLHGRSGPDPGVHDSLRLVRQLSDAQARVKSLRGALRRSWRSNSFFLSSDDDDVEGAEGDESWSGSMYSLLPKPPTARSSALGCSPPAPPVRQDSASSGEFVRPVVDLDLLMAPLEERADQPNNRMRREKREATMPRLTASPTPPEPRVPVPPSPSPDDETPRIPVTLRSPPNGNGVAVTSPRTPNGVAVTSPRTNGVAVTSPRPLHSSGWPSVKKVSRNKPTLHGVTLSPAPTPPVLDSSPLRVPLNMRRTPGATATPLKPLGAPLATPPPKFTG